MRLAKSGSILEAAWDVLSRLEGPSNASAVVRRLSTLAECQHIACRGFKPYGQAGGPFGTRQRQQLRLRSSWQGGPLNVHKPDLPRKLARPSIVKPIAFCVATSAAAFGAAAVAEERSFRHTWELFGGDSRARRSSESNEIDLLPLGLQNIYREFWQDVSGAQRAVTAITAVNVAVFAAFRLLPRLTYTLFLNFVHALPPLPSRSRTLLLSNFTHLGAMHLAVNSLAFWSFGTEAARILGVEQFLAFYVSAGLASGLLSHLGRIRSATGGFSVGASGAIYACFALTAVTRPDQEVVVIFLPWLPIQIGDALAVTVCLDLLGALRGWRTFDHFGHLGGALFGLAYAFRGQSELWPKFQQLAEGFNDRHRRP